MTQRRDIEKFRSALLLLGTLCFGLAAGSGACLAQFSPGPLSKAHHALDGPTRCTRCHAVAGGNRKFKCLGCHTEIRQRLAEHRGLHATMFSGNLNEQQCVRCHSEHNGVEFVPVRWDVSLDEFDHRKTGYALEGKHAGLACRKCHNAEHIRPQARRGLLVKDLGHTYLGLGRDCLSCHKDAHLGQLGADCQRCHDSSGWKNVTRFDHNTARFKLTGAHEKTACRKCHPEAAQPTPHVRFKGLAFNECSSCHKDPHRAAFAAPCQSCHSTRAWKPAQQVISNFDHSKTHFPLLGKHTGLVCEKCHKGADFKQPVAHRNCMDCHRDQHHGQFAARADRGECGACHVVDGWKPATFTVSKHAATGYPLDGRHAAVPCAKCHTPAGVDTVYKVKHAQCADCHQDPHNKQFAAQRCEECHTVKGFRPATFTLTRHQRTRFPLAGGHAAVPCADCHAEHTVPPTPGRFRFTDLSCAGCHQDPHRGQFRDRMMVAGCEACHTIRSWREVGKFDHSATTFPLVGSHRALSCDQCHRPADLSLGLKSVNFHAAPKQCSGCHEDIHGGQFAARGDAQDCSGCHNPLKWKPTSFDHNTATTFQLMGAHQDVTCAQCHKSRGDVKGRVVVLYKPTPRECSGCHGNQTSN